MNQAVHMDGCSKAMCCMIDIYSVCNCNTYNSKRTYIKDEKITTHRWKSETWWGTIEATLKYYDIEQLFSLDAKGTTVRWHSIQN
jgi:hypothetical protein